MLKLLKVTGVALLATLAVTNNAIAHSHRSHAVNKNTVPVQQVNLCNFSGQIGTFYDVTFTTTASGNAKIVSFPKLIQIGHGGSYTLAFPCSGSTKNDKITATAGFFMGTQGNQQCTFTFITSNSTLISSVTGSMYCSAKGSSLGIGFTQSKKR